MEHAADSRRDPATGHRQSPVSFARRGVRLSERQQAAWDDLAEAFVVDVPRDGASTSVALDAHLDLVATFGRSAPLVVEIGTGRGDALCTAAAESPDVDFLGLEVWTPGVAQALMMIRRLGLANVRMAVVNAPEAFATWLPEHGVAEVRTWFPDPWPKLRHHKRRLVSVPFTRLVARALEPDGTWRLATDWADYAEQMERVIAESDAVDGGRCERFAGRPVTKFEAKGIDAGREIHDLRAVPVRA
ncbi:tRNA (guanosine(46)-N7)-methyltransferase TrmB [Aeromicrobium sp. CF4.19]|uniref:tRNA (guanosine(46)-N7)-methyltransferase TrmB n=1 Tax=Aeromicrobium sp. CF4.19 TaxID=3373082 RepID=UPI003EE68E20